MNGSRSFLLMLSIIVLSSNFAFSKKYQFDFSNEKDTFDIGFAGYPVDDAGQYELTHNREKLDRLQEGLSGLILSGNNINGDLFMYIKRQVTGLKPFTNYRVFFNITLASDLAQKPASDLQKQKESITINAGLSVEEPITSIVDGYARLNIDKDDGKYYGMYMPEIGDIMKKDSSEELSIIKRSNLDNGLKFTTDESGSAWICIGTESAVKGVNKHYYLSITVDFMNYSDIQVGKLGSLNENIQFCRKIIKLKSSIGESFDGMECSVLNYLGVEVMQGVLRGNEPEIDIVCLPPGDYDIKVGNQTFHYEISSEY